ncbi:MAG: hypothetical protein KDE24_21380, partial [Caldilinea sp.]|nr:hypothetical protein [Caldilinea sp.]
GAANSSPLSLIRADDARCLVLSLPAKTAGGKEIWCFTTLTQSHQEHKETIFNLCDFAALCEPKSCN